MLLSQLVNQHVYVNNNLRGVCRGVGISLKNYAVKYLLCQSASSETARRTRALQADFAVNISSVSDFLEQGILLSKLRPVFPKSCVKIFPSRPIYSFDGAFLGNVADVELTNYTAVRIFTTDNEIIPFSSVTAFSDAVILKKEQPYPLGQRIPAPLSLQIFEKNEPLVTKSVLRAAIEKKTLICLTMALAPFKQNLDKK